MSIKPSNNGQQKQVTWGVLGKRKTFKNAAQISLEKKQKKEQFNLLEKLQPWSGEKDRQYQIMLTRGEPLPPEPTPVIWSNASDLWEDVTDLWNNYTKL
jgi:hypothetical protein